MMENQIIQSPKKALLTIKTGFGRVHCFTFASEMWSLSITRGILFSLRHHWSCSVHTMKNLCITDVNRLNQVGSFQYVGFKDGTEAVLSRGM